jgi:hypothetical protein
MPTYRDSHGHFCSREVAEAEGTLPEEELEGEVDETDYEEETFGAESRGGDLVPVDIGRGGQIVNVRAGSPFVETLERLADQANYGGYYKVYLNGSEVVNPSDAPATIESGMRIAITSYDKVG